MATVKSENPSKSEEIAVHSLRIRRAKLDRMHEIAAAEYRTLAGKLRAMIDEEIARDDARRAA